MNSSRTNSHPSKRSRLLFIILVVSLGAVYRLDFLASNSLSIDSDEAIVGLMAKHILEGRPVPIFYYGQHYMGSLEALSVSLLGKTFGLSVLTLKLVPLIFSLLLIWSIYEIAEEVAGEVAGWMAGLLVAIPPLSLLDWSTKARGGFVELLYLGSLAILLSLRAFRQDFPRDKTLAIGIVCGLAWWTNNQILYFLPSIGLGFFWGLQKRGARELSIHLLLGISGFLFGGLPFWIYNLDHQMASAGIFQFVGAREFFQHLKGFLSLSVPILLGAKRFWNSEDIFSGASFLFSIPYIVAIVLALRAKEPRLESVPRWRMFVTIFFVTVPLIFCASSFGALTEAPRYLLPLYLPIFLCLGVFAEILSRRSVKLSIAAVICFLSLNLLSEFWGGRSLPGEPMVMGEGRVPKSQQEILQWLDSHRISWVRTNYWIGYRLAFESFEKVRFLVHGSPHQIRIPEYESDEYARENRWNLPILTLARQAKKEERVLDSLGLLYHEDIVGAYVIFTEIHPKFLAQEEERIPNSDISAESNIHPEMASYISDGTTETRWATGGPQKKGMELRITLSHPYEVNALHSIIGKWSTDWPRGLEVSFEDPDGKQVDLGLARRYPEIQQIMAEEPDLWFWFPPRLVKRIILRQLGESKIFDWSLAEIEIFAKKNSPQNTQ